MNLMEQAVKLVIQEVVAVDNKDKSARIPVLLRLDNPKHRLVYNILESTDNKSAYIREAVIYYHRHKGISPEEDDVMDHIRLVVQECNQQLLAELDKRIGSKDLIDYDKLKNIF